MLLELIKEHKENCNKSDCGISVYVFKAIYENLIGRKVTKKEFKIFL